MKPQLSGGRVKAVQSDTDHMQAEMVINLYIHRRLKQPIDYRNNRAKLCLNGGY